MHLFKQLLTFIGTADTTCFMLFSRAAAVVQEIKERYECPVRFCSLVLEVCKEYLVLFLALAV